MPWTCRWPHPPCENLEPDAALGQVVDGVHERPQVAAEPVELPHQQGVPSWTFTGAAAAQSVRSRAVQL